MTFYHIQDLHTSLENIGIWWWQSSMRSRMLERCTISMLFSSNLPTIFFKNQTHDFVQIFYTSFRHVAKCRKWRNLLGSLWYGQWNFRKMSCYGYFTRLRVTHRINKIFGKIIYNLLKMFYYCVYDVFLLCHTFLTICFCFA